MLHNPLLTVLVPRRSPRNSSQPHTRKKYLLGKTKPTCALKMKIASQLTIKNKCLFATNEMCIKTLNW